jgi:eukaryotic-like serine/threonine-protein kinase
VIEGLLRKDPATRLDVAETEQMLYQIVADSDPSLAGDGQAEADGAATLNATPADTGTYPPPVGPRRFRAGLAALTAVAAIAVIAAGIATALGRSPGHQAAQRANTKASGTASPAGRGPSPSSAPSRSSAAPSAPSSPSAAASGNSGSSALPAGYYSFTNSTGFSIGVPRGWQISHDGHYVYIRDPANSGIFLLIDQSDQPRPNPLADWQQQAANRQGTYPGYHLILLRAVRYTQAEKAADWEFTYDRNGVMVEVLNRNILANAQHAYALYWSTPVSDWSAYYHYFQVFAATFRPAPAG